MLWYAESVAQFQHIPGTVSHYHSLQVQLLLSEHFITASRHQAVRVVEASILHHTAQAIQRRQCME